MIEKLVQVAFGGRTYKLYTRKEVRILTTKSTRTILQRIKTYCVKLIQNPSFVYFFLFFPACFCHFWSQIIKIKIFLIVPLFVTMYCGKTAFVVYTQNRNSNQSLQIKVSQSQYSGNCKMNCTCVFVLSPVDCIWRGRGGVAQWSWNTLCCLFLQYLLQFKKSWMKTITNEQKNRLPNRKGWKQNTLQIDQKTGGPLSSLLGVLWKKKKKKTNLSGNMWEHREEWMKKPFKYKICKGWDTKICWQILVRCSHRPCLEKHRMYLTSF